MSSLTIKRTCLRSLCPLSHSIIEGKAHKLNNFFVCECVCVLNFALYICLLTLNSAASMRLQRGSTRHKLPTELSISIKALIIYVPYLCPLDGAVNSGGKHIKYLPHKTIFNWASTVAVVLVVVACFRLLFSHFVCFYLAGAKNHLAVVFILP